MHRILLLATSDTTVVHDARAAEAWSRAAFLSGCAKFIWGGVEQTHGSKLGRRKRNLLYPRQATSCLRRRPVLDHPELDQSQVPLNWSCRVAERGRVGWRWGVVVASGMELPHHAVTVIQRFPGAPRVNSAAARVTMNPDIYSKA
jgi:hypothetical protein